MKILTTIFITFSIALAGSASAFQDASAEDSGQQASNATFDDAVGVAQKRLEDSLQELSALRKRIADYENEQFERFEQIKQGIERQIALNRVNIELSIASRRTPAASSTSLRSLGRGCRC